MCIVLQSTLLHQGFGVYKPDFILIIITYLALNRFAIEGGIMAYLLGYLIELNSGAPVGLYSVVMVLTFYCAKLLSEGFFIYTMISQMLLVMTTSIVSKVFFLLIVSMYGSVSNLWSQVLFSLLSMVCLNFLLTPIVFFILKQGDNLFMRDIPSKTGSKESTIELYS